MDLRIRNLLDENGLDVVNFRDSITGTYYYAIRKKNEGEALFTIAIDSAVTDENTGTQLVLEAIKEKLEEGKK